MRNEEMMVLGLAGLALWFILKGKNATAGAMGAKLNNYTGKAAPDYQGWQYFTDGTAIAPNGDYYHNGDLVYSAP